MKTLTKLNRAVYLLGEQRYVNKFYPFVATSGGGRQRSVMVNGKRVFPVDENNEMETVDYEANRVWVEANRPQEEEVWPPY